MGLVFIALVSAAVVNQLRPAPLPWDWRPDPPSLPVTEDFEALEKFINTPNALLVDARDEFLYRMGHIPGAINMPSDETSPEQIAAWQKGLPPQAEIIIYCSDAFCHMAEELGEKMIEAGLSPVIFLPGFDEWENRGLPIIGEAADD
ncbi:rhodanese-like domain-containing protein [Deltaproteobacteria bacterium OttesenSCG-928-K17]|nr:rhodanese-like domain-containing protein [Deltaproteobacteria bacterium OttesenSCG-928-K17]